MPPVVFLGPTLSRKDAEALLAAEFRPPAGRGDVYRAFRDGFQTIILIDGEFHGRPAVWQREIADVIAEGAAVHGASSIGALRAAELWPFGMVGHGRIFELYRSGSLAADDEVALLYGPAELGYPALSEPLVNLRATVAAATPAVLLPGERDHIVERLRALPFPERSYDALLRMAPADRRETLAGFLEQGRIDVKREDAIMALAAVAKGDWPVVASASMPPDGWWRGHRLVAEGRAPSPAALDATTIGMNAGLAPTDIESARLNLSAQFFLALAAEEEGLKPSAADLAVAARECPGASRMPAIRREPALRRRALARAVIAREPAKDREAARLAVLVRWAERHGIARPTMSDAELVEWIVEAGPNRFGYARWRFEVELVEALELLGGTSLAERPAA